MSRWLGAFKIPLIGGLKASEKSAFQRSQDLRSITVTKPPTRLGGSYMSDKVAERRPIVLCTSCQLKYRRWWKREGYHGDFGFPYKGDCNGCGDRDVSVMLFVAEETFYKVLTNSHGLSAQT